MGLGGWIRGNRAYISSESAAGGPFSQNLMGCPATRGWRFILGAWPPIQPSAVVGRGVKIFTRVKINFGQGFYKFCDSFVFGVMGCVWLWFINFSVVIGMWFW